MKLSPSFLRFCLLVAGMSLLSGPILAAEVGKDKPPQNGIAIIDVQRILQESLAAKSVQKQLEIQRSKFQSQTEKEENGLRQSEQELSRSRGKVAADVYADREQQLRQRFLTVERHVQARRKVLDQAFTESMNTVRSNLLEIVGVVARERSVNLVLIKQQILWMEQTLDITDEVLGRLNKKLPQVAVKLPPEDSK